MQDPNDKKISLEQFAQANRPAFDELETIDEARLWNAIQIEIPASLRPASGWRIELGNYWKWSAAACIAIAILLGINYNTSKEPNTPTASIEAFYPELKPTQVKYQQLIQEKEVSLQLSEINKGAYTDIFYELKILDEIYAELLVELPHFSDQERVKEILLRYYERKLKTLEILSKEIQRQQKQKRYVEDDQLI